MIHFFNNDLVLVKFKFTDEQKQKKPNTILFDVPVTPLVANFFTIVDVGQSGTADYHVGSYKEL